MKENYRDNIKIFQLRALVAVADHSNFSEAALHLQISQSAVSHAIAALEEELGVVLFSRGRYGAHLTPVGEQVMKQALQVLQLVEGIRKTANLAKGLQGGIVRVASFRSAATHLLPAVVTQFRSKFPAITVTLTEYYEVDGVEQALRHGHADLGLVTLPTTAEFEASELLRDEFLVLLPPNFPQPDLPLTWEQLATYPLILPPDNNCCGWIIRNHFVQLGQTLNAAYEVREDSTIVSMVMQGLGATVIARLAAEPLPAGVQVLSLPVPLERVIGVAMLADGLYPPAVFAFFDTLKQICQSQGEIYQPKLLVRN